MKNSTKAICLLSPLALFVMPVCACGQSTGQRDDLISILNKEVTTRSNKADFVYHIKNTSQNKVDVSILTDNQNISIDSREIHILNKTITVTLNIKTGKESQVFNFGLILSFQNSKGNKQVVKNNDLKLNYIYTADYVKLETPIVETKTRYVDIDFSINQIPKSPIKVKGINMPSELVILSDSIDVTDTFFSVEIEITIAVADDYHFGLLLSFENSYNVKQEEIFNDIIIKFSS